VFAECPHCRARGIFLADRRCPACRRGYDEPSTAKADLTLATFREGQSLPTLCIACAEPTAHLVPAQRQDLGKDAGDLTDSWILFRLLRLSILGLFSMMGRTKRTRRLSLRVPMCEGCVATRKDLLDPRHIDFEQNEATFLVNRRFEEAYRNQHTR
jgi:hypothetical protein